MGLEEEKAEFLIAHPDEIEEFDQTLDHQFRPSEKILNVKRNGKLFPSETPDTEKADIEVPMSHRDSIQLYGGPSLEGSVIRSLHKTLDEHQELASETSRYSWETEGSSRVSDADIPVYPGEEDIASTSIEVPSSIQKLDVTPVVLESKTFTSSAASLLKQFWQFSSQESIRKKAATQDLLTSLDVSPVESFKIDTETSEILNITEAIEAEPLDPAILKYCWHLDGDETPRESMDTEVDRSATLEDCVVSHSYTTSKSLDSICFIQRRSTDVTVDDGAYYDVPTKTDDDLVAPHASSPERLTRSDSRDSGTNVNSRRARIDARKSKSASILDSLYLGRQNWNKKRHAKMADKEKAIQEFAKIQRAVFNDFTNTHGSH
ncbi:hypothetical protein SCHPADRAFT_909175 [Schizopora paradoxa]|uniref:Uncharacterized protein n=1 Tax=Schizopora paradoxa TaxID=27342 RepID=A0A0H2R7E3_9AGAM|nr:hypothetical protein SCHPADRAFT_909175 [Schizopora paradoxa]